MRLSATLSGALVAGALVLTCIPASAAADTAKPPAPGSGLRTLLGQRAAETVVGRETQIDGIAVAPSRAVPQATATALAATRVPVTGFVHYGYAPQALPQSAVPYWGQTTARIDSGMHDATGVRMYLLGGRLYNHPVGQASYGIANLSQYDLNKDVFYLNRAIAQAQRLVDTKVISDDAWYFPYPFNFALHGNLADMMTAPWYSGMAQGQALSLFARLAKLTGDPAWRTAADHTFASLQQAPAAGAPSVSRVDSKGFLWFDEYPSQDPAKVDLTLNGHMFAVFGVYDYWVLTQDPAAASLFDGSASMVRSYAASFRNVYWQSKYCLRHSTDADKYHQIHVNQLLYMQSLTGQVAFASYSDAYRSDYPKPTVAGTVILVTGTWTGYTFGASGNVTGSKSIRLSGASQTTADRRQRIKGRGVYYHVTVGSLTGYWLMERPSYVHLRVKAAQNVYFPQRTAHFGPGPRTGYSFTTSATIAGSRTMTFATVSNAPFDSSAYIDAVLYLHITAGAFAGLWVPASTVTID